MSQPLAQRRDESGQALDSALQALELERSGAEPVLAALRRFDAQPGRYSDFPPDLHARLAGALRARGVERLYTHQREVYDAARAGGHVVVVTPTASGKTLCYNLPVLDAILKDPAARALYLFPTKALAQDQLAELDAMIRALGVAIGGYTYDGDTPADARKAIRTRAQVVVTNPDMLHKGILPHHTNWAALLENLRYVVVDELHSQRGVYGSHVANLFRRLDRLCRFYGSDPRYLCASATIGNPRELAEALTGREMTLVERSGAPRGERVFAIYNPPVVNQRLGIRRAALGCARDVARGFLARGLQTIVFAPSRLATEVLVSTLKEALASHPGGAGAIRGYRGGYLPLQRREIERGLRDGSVRGVVSTNALELGIDIGGLDAAVLLGYPGSVASAWQQAGRAGRRSGASVAVLVANSTPLNQFIARNPDYFFDAPVEQARINPDNLQILLSHVKCAAFELPFAAGERFGGEDLAEILRFLEERGLLHRAGGRWHWTSESYPAEAVSLRSVSSDNFVVQDVTPGRTPRVIAEVDYDSAPAVIHEKAVYLLEGRAYLVEAYDRQQRRAQVHEAELAYYTQAVSSTSVRVLDRFAEETLHGARRGHGEVHVANRVVGFKKIKFWTNENVGSGALHMPENEMHTTAYWLTLPRELLFRLGLTGEERNDGVAALSHALGQLAALFLMCDRHDLGVALGDSEQGGAGVGRGLARLNRADAWERPGPDFEPSVFLYDNYPGGIGLSEPLYRLHERLLSESLALVERCACQEGCPSCVGPPAEQGGRGKQVALALLRAMAP